MKRVRIHLLHILASLSPFVSFYIVWFFFKYLNARIKLSIEDKTDLLPEREARVKYFENFAITFVLAVVVSIYYLNAFPMPMTSSYWKTDLESIMNMSTYLLIRLGMALANL